MGTVGFFALHPNFFLCPGFFCARALLGRLVCTPQRKASSRASIWHLALITFFPAAENFAAAETAAAETAAVVAGAAAAAAAAAAADDDDIDAVAALADSIALPCRSVWLMSS